jgi:hypothetical protein
MGTSGYQRFEAQGRVTAAGCYGFQAMIRYRDPRVHWIAQVMGHACLTILKQTGLPDSPLYWANHTDWQQARPINDYLVDLFHRLLEQVEASAAMPGAEDQKQIIGAEIAAHLTTLKAT